MESKKINQLATNLSPVSTDLTIIGDPITGVSKKVTLLQIASLFAGAVDFYDNLAAFPVTGSINTLYCAKDTNKLYLWSGSAYVQTFPSQALLDTYQLRSEKGVSNGYASLDSSGKVPIAQLPSSIMEYKGTWSAATNTPTLANGTGDTGDVYICNAAGSVNFGAGAITFAIGDYVVYSGTIWQRSGGAVGTVTSVGLSTNGNSITIGSSPITTSGTITANFAGDSTQYINGAGNLITFPTLFSSDSLVKLVRNNSGATMTAGTIIYINGALGNKPTIAKALATGDSTSAQTYGLLQADIANNADGYVVVIGNVTNLDTSALTEGQQLYLSGTTAGTWTTTKPYAPIHLVYVGIVLKAHPTMGIIGVKIQNGYEMDELHNVDAYLPNNNDILSYNTTTSLWEHKQIATTLGYTPQAALNGTGFVKISGTTISYDNSTYLTTSAASTTYLPMILSATAKNVDINGQQFNIYGTAGAYTSGRIVVDPLFAAVGYQISGLFDGLTISTDGSALFSNSGVTRFMNQVRFDSTLTNGTYTYTLPSATGTIALTSDIPSLAGYVPYTGATTNVNLGGNTIYADNFIIQPSGYSILASLTRNLTGTGFGALLLRNGSNATIQPTNLTVDRTYTLPDASGTIALVGGSGIGTVTSVAMTVPTGLSISGSPITTSGTLALTFSAGYSIPTTASQTTWDTAYTNRITSLTTTGSSGSATLVTNTLNIPTYTLTGLGGQPLATNLTSLSSLTYVSTAFVKMTAAGTFSLDTTAYGTGTVTSVAALTIGTTGTDLSSSVATGTTTPVITLNVPTASAANRGALSSADWTTFNNKQSALTNPVTGTGTTNYLPKFTGTSTIGNSAVSDDGTSVAVGVTITANTGNLQVGGTANTSLFSQQGTDTVRIGVRASGRTGISLDSSNTTFTNRMWYLDNVGANGSLTIGRSGLDVLTFSNSGNLGLGVTPSAWSTGKAIDIGSSGAVFGDGINTAYTAGISQNAYLEANVWKYKISSQPTGRYEINGASHAWYLATSGTAGNAITFTQAMTLFANGNLAVGTSTDSGYKLDVNGTGRFSGASIIETNGATPQFRIRDTTRAASGAYWYMQSSGGTFYLGSSTDSGGAYSGLVDRLTIASTGAATFSSSVGIGGVSFSSARASNGLSISGSYSGITIESTGTTARKWDITANYSSGTAFLEFYDETAAAARMVINASGNVGIGTSSPTAISGYTITQIEGSTSGLLALGSGGTVQGRFYGGSTLLAIDALGSRDIVNYTNSTERMRITSGGNVLIGTTDDGGRLVSYSTTAATQIKAAGTAPAITFSNTVLSPTIGGVLGACTAASQFLTGTAAGDMILINQFTGNKLYITNYSGGVYLTQGATSWTANSDIKLKNINSHIENAVEKLSTLQTINFSYKDDKTNKQNLGLIAQEVEKIFPELIDKNGDGMLGVRYTELVPVLIKAIQELKLEIETLKNK